MAKEDSGIARIIGAIIFGMVGVTVIASISLLMVSPTGMIYNVLNATMYRQTGGTGTAWNKWTSFYGFARTMYGTLTVFLIIGTLAIIYLWATRKEYYEVMY